MASGIFEEEGGEKWRGERKAMGGGVRSNNRGRLYNEDGNFLISFKKQL